MWRRGSAVLAASIASAGACVLYAFDPMRAGFFPPCPFHLITGLQCPGCGATRALHHLLHGDVAGAFHLNAMLIIASPLLAAGAIAEARALLLDSARPAILHKPVVAWTAAILLIGWAVLRNVIGV